MPASGPSFCPYPFERLRRVGRREAAFESAAARLIAARPSGRTLASLVGGEVGVRVVGSGARRDPHAALAEVRVAGTTIELAAAAQPIRVLAQRWLGGPDELAAPRPLTVAEHAIWVLVVAAALADLGVAGEAWPVLDEPPGANPAASDAGRDHVTLELAVTLGDLPIRVVARVPRALELAVPTRACPAWSFDLPVVVARTAVPRDALATLGLGDAITVEPALELGFAGGAVPLTAAPGALEATVTTGYVPRAMALPDDAHLELTVQLGTTRLSLRQLSELAVGQLIPLGRPLAGPFEVRAGGRVVGEGELIDIDGELGVRIVSLAQE